MILLTSLSAALLATGSPASSGHLTITGVSEETADGLIPLSVTTGDLDGDGVADKGTLYLRCDGGSVMDALFYDVKSPRDGASGQASGKRTHIMPHVFDAASPSLAKMSPGYDVKTMKGGRMMAGKKGYDAYQSLSLTGADGLCPAAAQQASTVRATKSRSNIQNN